MMSGVVSGVSGALKTLVVDKVGAGGTLLAGVGGVAEEGVGPTHNLLASHAGSVV
jgi:hypothetical protein